ncbi:MAG: M23 family metallopeptidase [Bacteroidales bacterium]
MAKNKFRFNPNTLSFEPIQTPFSKKIANVIIQFILSLTIAVFVFFTFNYFFETPKEKVLKRENSELALKFELFNKMLDESDMLLTEIHQRDNHIYRSIFEADTIPASLKTGGMGGEQQYEELTGFLNSDLLIETATKLDHLAWKTYVQSKSFDEVVDLAKNKEQMIQSIPAIQPISFKDFGRVSAYFGPRSDPFTKKRKFHHGIDFVGPKGAPIYAAGKGKVTRAEYSFFGYGNLVEVDHGFGYKTRYAHLKDIKVRKGDLVSRGQIVGTLGNSGRSTGPHLHYEVIHRNKTVNPINYFNEMSADEYELMVSNAGSNDLKN